MKNSQRFAVYPGSFDPITMGHVDIIERISKLFEKVVVLIAQSPHKSSLFSIDERKKLIAQSLKHLKNIEVEHFHGLTVDYMKSSRAHVIVRGLRAVVDFEYEMTMANMNKQLAPQIETLLVCARPEYYYISSRGVKEVASHQGETRGMVPECVIKPLQKKFRKHRRS